MSDVVIFRVDASAAVGLGHLARSATLAAAFATSGRRPVFVTTTPDVVRSRLPYPVIALDALAGGAEDGERTAAEVAVHRARHVVVDGYVFGGPFRDALAGAPALPVWIDDDGFTDRRPGAVLNQHFHATAALYPAVDRERLLLGPSFALLRDEIVAARTDATPDRSRAPVVVTMGGADPPNATGAILDTVAQVAGRRGHGVRVIVGPQNPHRASLEGRPGVVVVVDPPRMAAELQAASVVITAAGGTAMELCCLGVPAIVLAIVENQRPIAAALDRLGLMDSAGALATLDGGVLGSTLDRLLTNPMRAEQMRSAQRAAIDGRGALRVIDTLARLA